MMRFTLQETTIYADHSDPIYNLESQINKLDELPRRKRIALLYNDAKNYEMGSIPLYEAWLEKRISFVKDLSQLDWIGLSRHLNLDLESQLGNMAQLIHKNLETLSRSPFDLSLFCLTLSRIDHLSHILMPRHLQGFHDPILIEYLTGLV